jgi:hypothetical protein
LQAPAISRRRSLLWVGLAVAGFLVVLLLRPPARVVVWFLPAQVHCEQIAGTLWQGRCGQAWVQRAALPEQIKVQLSWQLLPARLLRGRLAVQINVSRGASAVQAVVQRSASALEVLSIRGTLLLEDQLLPGVPAGWHGTASADDLRFKVQGVALQALEGRVLLRNVSSVVPTSVGYGNYSITWPRANGGALQPARIVDEGGPLAMQAQLLLEPSGGWQLQGTVALRSAPSPVLAGQLQLLGPADAAGLRQFSIAGRP